MRRIEPLLVAAIAALSASAPACKAGECGEGTIEEAGVCVPASSIGSPGECCGEGTHYDPTSQACVSDFPPTLCEEGSPDPVVLEDGVLECCGCFLFELCQVTCQSPRPGTVSVCGVLRDMETGNAVARPGCMSAAECDPDRPDTGGSCALEPRFFDAVDLAENGADATALTVDGLEWNACGAYAARSVAMPGSGLLAVVFDDASGHDPARDEFAPVAAVFAVASEERVEDRDAFALRRSTDEGWTEVAGSPFGGDTFVEHGVEVVRFRRGSAAVEGVAVTDEGGEPLASAYYFSNVYPNAFAGLDPEQSSTGPNGAALIAPDAAILVRAQGGLLADCIWPEGTVEPLPGYLVVSDRVAEVEATGEPCE